MTLLTFFYRFILSEYPGKISAKQLYEEVTKKSKNWGAKEIIEFTKKLNASATVYTELIDGKIGNLRINRRLQDIKSFEASPSYTLLMKITPLFKDGRLNEDQYLKIIDFIESFHIRWGICGQSTSRLNDIYNQICTKLRLDNSDGILSDIEDNYLSWASPINDSVFKASFQKEFAQFSASRTKYIIWKLGKPAGEVSLNFDEVHTEHILPQTLNDEWIFELEKSSEMSKGEVKKTHDLLINKMGNFALIKGEWNISMSNRVFSKKKENYVKSEIQPTQELAKRHSWTFDDIIERTNSLADVAIQIWKFDKPISDANVEIRTRNKKYPIADSVKLFCKAQDVLAIAHIIDKSIVRIDAGSSARKKITPSFNGGSYFKLREELLNKGVLSDNGDLLIFKKDYDFDSLSAAASIVLGVPTDGQIAWKNKNDISIYKIMEGDSGEAPSINKEIEIIDSNKYLIFYNDLVDKLKILMPNKYPTPSQKCYYQIPTNIKYVHFEWIFRKNGFSVELHFESNDKNLNLESIKKLEEIKGLKEKLEQTLEEEIVFEKNRKWTKIYITRKNLEITEELKDWAVNKMKVFIEILQPELDKIK